MQILSTHKLDNLKANLFILTAKKLLLTFKDLDLTDSKKQQCFDSII